MKSSDYSNPITMKWITPDAYREFLNTVHLNDTARLRSQVWEALKSAEQMSADDVKAMQIETNIVWLFESAHTWDDLISNGQRLFNAESLPYLLKRSGEAAQPVFSAYYWLAAWIARRKRDYASNALDALLASIKQFEVSTDSGERFIGLRRTVFLAYGVAAAAQRLDEVRTRVFQLVRDLEKPFGILRAELAKLLVDDSKTDKSILASLSPIVADLMTELAAGDYDLLQGLSILGKRIDAKLGQPQDRKWHQRYGEALVCWMGCHPEPMVKALAAQKAIAAFSQAGDEEKAIEMRGVLKNAIHEQETITIMEVHLSRVIFWV